MYTTPQALFLVSGIYKQKLQYLKKNDTNAFNASSFQVSMPQSTVQHV